MDPILELILLVVIGFLVGIINTVSGGGSLLTLPLLIFIGLPSNVANGTNRIAILVQNVFALAGFKSKGATKQLTFGWYLAVAALIGSLIGAQFASDIDDKMFNRILAVVMVIIVGFMLLKPKTNILNMTERISGKYLVRSVIVFFIIGLYGGFIQAGTGIFILLTLSSLNKLSMVRSNIIKAMVMLIYTIGALVMFGIYGLLDWKVGLMLASGQALGAWLSSRWSVNKDDRVIRMILIFMIVAMAVKLWFFS